jgi:hypothetical protein
MATSKCDRAFSERWNCGSTFHHYKGLGRIVGNAGEVLESQLFGSTRDAVEPRPRRAGAVLSHRRRREHQGNKSYCDVGATHQVDTGNGSESALGDIGERGQNVCKWGKADHLLNRIDQPPR